MSATNDGTLSPFITSCVFHGIFGEADTVGDDGFQLAPNWSQRSEITYADES